MSRLKEELGDNGVRFLAARVEGKVAGWCEMRCSEAGGQVEDVVVLELAPAPNLPFCTLTGFAIPHRM